MIWTLAILFALAVAEKLLLVPADSGHAVAAIAPWIIPAGMAGLNELFGSKGGDKTSRSVNLAPWGENEGALHNENLLALRQMLSQLGPAGMEAMMGELQKSAYDPQARAINTGYDRSRSTNEARMLRRGVGPSSGLTGMLRDIEGQRAGQLSDAASRSRLMAEEMGQGRMALGNQAFGQMANLHTTLWNPRLARSGATATAPSTMTSDLLGLSGYMYGNRNG